MPTYTLTYTAGSHGSISGTTPQTVNSGASGTTVTAIPSTGYVFLNWSDGILTASRKDTNVTANKSVTASFVTTPNSIVESIRNYFINCPYLNTSSLINIYKVLPDPINYSIDPVSAQLVILEDVLGVKTKEFNFYFTTTQHCKTTEQELAIQLFLENIVSWIEAKEDSMDYPTSYGKRIEVVNTPDLYSKDVSLCNGIYQILIKYTYKK
jgi:hypothetical protein